MEVAAEGTPGKLAYEESKQMIEEEFGEKGSNPNPALYGQAMLAALQTYTETPSRNFFKRLAGTPKIAAAEVRSRSTIRRKKRCSAIEEWMTERLRSIMGLPLEASPLLFCDLRQTC